MNVDTIGGPLIEKPSPLDRRLPIQPHLDIELWEKDIDQWWLRREAELKKAKDKFERVKEGKISSFAEVVERFQRRLERAG